MDQAAVGTNSSAQLGYLQPLFSIWKAQLALTRRRAKLSKGFGGKLLLKTLPIKKAIRKKPILQSVLIGDGLRDAFDPRQRRRISRREREKAQVAVRD